MFLKLLLIMPGIFQHPGNLGKYFACDGAIPHPSPHQPLERCYSGEYQVLEDFTNYGVRIGYSVSLCTIADSQCGVMDKV